MSASEIVAVGAARTPLGNFGGTLRDTSVWDLGAAAVRGALERAGVEGHQIDQVVLANCRQAGNGANPARTASVRGGVSISVPAFTVNMACPSGMKAVMLANRELASKNATMIVAGGMESMSTMPYLLKNARWEGFKGGDRVLQDSWNDAFDPICGLSVGITAENQASKYGISREHQDAFALESQQKAAKARSEGLMDCEITPFRLPPSRRSSEGFVMSADETGRPDTTAAALARLKPAFKADGTVTAGNACTMGDGACALVLTTREVAKALGLMPLFSIVAFAEVGCDPAFMGDGPNYSIPAALATAGMTIADVDFIEVNEAFAVQVIANERAIGWDRAKLNVHGGAIALSHPTGISGTRMLIALDNIMRRRNGEIGLAAICGGGGVSTAMIIRRTH